MNRRLASNLIERKQAIDQSLLKLRGSFKDRKPKELAKIFGIKFTDVESIRTFGLPFAERLTE